MYSRAVCCGNQAEGSLLIISTSKIYGSAYMEYLLPELSDFLAACRELLFIPYARPGGLSYEAYTELPRKALGEIDITVRGLHEYSDKAEAIAGAQAIFVGGGNTFLLLKTLYDEGLLEPLREAVAGGTPYMGSSAGSNIAGLSIGTTNDMPIVYPPSFEALALLPFNLNPHYQDPIPNSRHMGETRETRIDEFLTQNPQPVLGLREGSWLRLQQGELSLRGEHSARLFRAGSTPRELPVGAVDFLLQES